MTILEEYLKILIKESNPEFIKKYLNTPSLIRLKDIGYFCGMDYASKDIYDFKEYISRYDHSLTTALLTWRYTKSKKATLAALYHDISTPCFSHVIDYMNKDYKIQESTELYTKTILENDKLLLNYLKQDKLLLSDIDFKNHNIVDNTRPKLCTDRLDGVILTSLFWTKKLNIKEIKEILNDITLYKNENNIDEIGFKSLSVANKILELNRHIDIYCHSKEDTYMMELLANITKSAIEKNIITYEDLYKLNEEELMKLLNNSRDLEILNNLKMFKKIKLNEIPDIKLPDIKVRKLMPLVNGKRLK